MRVETLCQQNDSAFFAYDLEAMAAHLRNLGSDGVRLWYATKANPLSSILNTIKEAEFGFDVASLGELEQVLRIGADPNRVLLTGPGKSEKFLVRALEAGVEIFVLESYQQLELLQRLLLERNSRAQILLRIQLEWDDAERSVLGGNSISAFGLDWEQWRSLDLNSYSQVDFLGFHSFQWGNIQDSSRMVSIWKSIFQQMQGFARDWGLEEIPVVDLGGGLGIPYDKSGVAFPWSDVGPALESLRKEFSVGEIWLELGRYAVGPYGMYCTKVVDRKTVRGKELLVLEGGMNHIIRPSLVSEPFPTSLLRDSNVEMQKFQVHGPLCTALDNYGAIELPGDVQVGDWLVMRQAGAYGFTESMPFFLCHELAAEYVWTKGDWQEIRPSKGAETWLR